VGRRYSSAALSSSGLTISRVLVAVVSWNSAAHLRDAIASVPEGVPVVVVDNASMDGSAEIARAAGARVIDAGANLGFGAACNRAAAEGAPSETILFLNPDAALVDGARTLAALLAALDADPAVAAVAPRLEGDGQDRFQLRRLPSARGLVREALLVDRLFPDNAGLRRDRYLDEDRGATFDVEQPAAAALSATRARTGRVLTKTPTIASMPASGAPRSPLACARSTHWRWPRYCSRACCSGRLSGDRCSASRQVRSAATRSPSAHWAAPMCAAISGSGSAP